jgi:hypothetical protein
MLISIHVPKTAGTNFTRTLEAIYGDRIHMDYGTERDLTAARTPAPEIANDPDAFAKRFDVIHGHYHYMKYQNVYPDAPVLATLRHPVARVASQYRHIALHGDRNVERHRLIMDGEMDIVKFSRFRFIGNAQAAYLEGLGIETLTHAIIQEHFPKTVERFCEAVGFDPKDKRVQSYVAKPINSREKSSWNTKAIPVDPATFPMIEKFCADDMAIYEKAVERFAV